MNLPGMPHLGVYRVISADNPWEHANYSQLGHGAAKAVYDEMPLEVLAGMPVGELAHPEGALLLSWCTGAQEADGAHKLVAEAWGFRLCTRLLTWVKVYESCVACGHAWDSHAAPGPAEDLPGACGVALRRSHATCSCPGFIPRARRGPGSYSMQGTESLWLGTRGDTPWSESRARRDIPETLFAPCPTIPGTKRPRHSAKPARARERIEALWPEATPRLELFARERAAGWAAWGAQAPDCDLVFGEAIGTTWPVPRPADDPVAVEAAADFPMFEEA